MSMTEPKSKMPGPRASAFFVAAALIVSAAPALAQQQPLAPGQSVAQPQIQPPPSIRPTPSQLELSKMIWSIMAAVDHANLSGNYSVLRDISAQGFQIQNNAARLTEIFATIRNSRTDLSNTLLVPPTYTQAPQMVREDIFRVQGLFQTRPSSLAFDLYFQWEQGRWKLVGIDLQPLEMIPGAAG
ncbi:MAG: hypothetical protein WA954_06725 [Parerythrobacter sp.]